MADTRTSLIERESNKDVKRSSHGMSSSVKRAAIPSTSHVAVWTSPAWSPEACRHASPSCSWMRCHSLRQRGDSSCRRQRPFVPIRGPSIRGRASGRARGPVPRSPKTPESSVFRIDMNRSLLRPYPPLATASAVPRVVFGRRPFSPSPAINPRPELNRRHGPYHPPQLR